MSISAPTSGPHTATGTDSGNIDGQAIAITVFSTVKRWQWPPLWALFLVVRFFPGRTKTLADLSFIHFARWSLIKRIPGNGPQKRERLHYGHLFFESNFNGGWEEYIDAFSHILTSGMKAFWGSSYGFPQALPTAPFKAYIKRNEIEANHFYSAYPDATTTMVLAALKLEPRVAAFLEGTRDADPDEFAAAWRALLTESQGQL